MGNHSQNEEQQNREENREDDNRNSNENEGGIENSNENKNGDNNNINDNSSENKIEITFQKEYIWIDPVIDSKENTYFYNYLFEEKKIDCKKYKNIDEAYNFLITRPNEFKEIVIIISGKLFTDFYHKIKNNINNIKFSPTIIVFTSKADLFINQLKMNNIYYNNDLFNTKLIFTNTFQIEDFINGKIEEESDLTFDIIDNLEQLIIPHYYSYLVQDVNFPEILYFNSFLKRIILPPTKKEKDELIKASNNIRLNQLYGNETIQNLFIKLN